MLEVFFKPLARAFVPMRSHRRHLCADESEAVGREQAGDGTTANVWDCVRDGKDMLGGVQLAS